MHQPKTTHLYLFIPKNKQQRQPTFVPIRPNFPLPPCGPWYAWEEKDNTQHNTPALLLTCIITISLSAEYNTCIPGSPSLPGKPGSPTMPWVDNNVIVKQVTGFWGCETALNCVSGESPSARWSHLGPLVQGSPSFTSSDRKTNPSMWSNFKNIYEKLNWTKRNILL